MDRLKRITRILSRRSYKNGSDLAIEEDSVLHAPSHPSIETSQRHGEELFSAMSQLPNELLSIIFVECLPEQKYTPIYSTSAPLVLTYVCRVWRLVALSTPELWNSIRIVTPNNWNANLIGLPSTVRLLTPETWDISEMKLISNKLARLVKLWLSRSGSLPLSISLISTAEIGNASIILLRCILPFSRRWTRVKMRVRPSVLAEVGRLTEDETPLLQELDIDGYNEEPFGLELASVAKLQRLHTLRLGHLVADILTIPWSQLVQFRWEHPLKLRDAFAILQQCQSLETCFMIVDFDDRPTLPPLFVLPKLQKLVLDLISYSVLHFERLFNCISLPSLHTLSICALANPGFTPFSQEAPFIPLLTFPSSEGLSPITHLELLDFPINSESFLECLQLTPALLYLHVRESQDASITSDHIIRRLTHPATLGLSGERVIPQLQTLILERCDISETALLNFVRSRSFQNIQSIDDSCETLRSQRIRLIQIFFRGCSPRKSNEDVRQQFLKLVEEGIHIELQYGMHSTAPSSSFPSWKHLSGTDTTIADSHHPLQHPRAVLD